MFKQIIGIRVTFELEKMPSITVFLKLFLYPRGAYTWEDEACTHRAMQTYVQPQTEHYGRSTSQPIMSWAQRKRFILPEFYIANCIVYNHTKTIFYQKCIF